jgi:glutamate-1-semialdehyde 2,1-aminomutase
MTMIDNTGIAARALAAFPAGISNGEFGLPSDTLVAIERGEGARLWDTDGKEYLDFSIGWGSALVGHARPEVVEAVVQQAPRGSNFAYLNANALALAEEIKRVSPAAEHLRFCASGTEAMMYCARLARAFAGKPKLLKFEGAYHGANEPVLRACFPSAASITRNPSTRAPALRRSRPSFWSHPSTIWNARRPSCAATAARWPG